MQLCFEQRTKNVVITRDLSLIVKCLGKAGSTIDYLDRRFTVDYTSNNLKY